MDWRSLLKRATLVCICFIPLMVLMVWLPVTGASAHRTTVRSTSLIVTTPVQNTPTIDATVIYLQKEQLAEQINQLKNENDRGFWSWVWSNASAVLSNIALAAAGGFTVFRYYSDRRAERKKQQTSEVQQFADRQDERNKREEEQKRWLADREIERGKQTEARFQKVVEGLGSSSEAMQIGSAILLRTFVRQDEGNERFYAQAFDLAAAHLQHWNNTNAPEPLSPLRRELVIALKDSFHRARDWPNPAPETLDAIEALDATEVQLDSVYLSGADLNHIWMPGAYLRAANLSKVKLRKANLRKAHISNKASLWEADLREANLRGANLSEANLSSANLSGTYLSGANLQGAHLGGANLQGADFRDAVLRDANLKGADLRGANLQGVDLSVAKNLKDAKLDGVKGLNQSKK